jgi:Tol biopolymer transport system component
MEVSRLTRFLLAGIATLPLCAQALDIELISRTGIESAMDSDGPTEQIAGITPDGRYTLFPSYADNLVAGDSNRVVDLFVHDATSGTLERVSVGSGGIQADVATGTRAGLSDDARYVVFDSTATTLVATPTFGHRQIYLRDRLAGTTSLLSKFSGGVAGNADSTNPQISADGRYVVFDTRVAFDGKDANGARDVYRLDRQTGLFELMSISETGRIGNAESFEPQISADGSSVAFFTWATNLVPNDTNGYWDLLLRKPAAGTTQRISRKSNGSELPGFANLVPISALSADGRYVLMNTYVAIDDLDTNSAGDGYRYDSQTGEVQRVTRDSTGAQIEGYTSVDAMSRDGVRIVMHSSAANVMPGLPSGSRVFVRDIGNTTVTHVTFRNGSEIAGDEASGAVMSDDGTNVVAVTYNGSFVTGDINSMADVIRQDSPTSPAYRLSAPRSGATAVAANHESGVGFQGYSASTDGRYVAFGSQASNLVVGDNNNSTDVFVRDRLLGTTERVSVHSNGTEGWCGSSYPSISDDGRYVAFYSCTPFDLEVPSLRMDIYVRDRVAHTTRLVSLTPQGTPADDFSTGPSLSADGRYVAFDSCATDLVAGDSNARCDIFVRDLVNGATTLVTRSIDTAGSNQNTYAPQISRNGRYVGFTSTASNLVADDTNAVDDAFVFDRDTQSLERVSLGSQEEQANSYSFLQGISDDGSEVLFFSVANNLVPGSPFAAMYLRDRAAGTTEIVSRASNGTYIFTGGPAAMSGDGRRIAFVTLSDDVAPPGAKLMLFDRDASRLDFVRQLDDRFGIGPTLAFTGNGSELLLASADNTFVADDGNNHFSDVFVLSRIEDTLFANGFEISN